MRQDLAVADKPWIPQGNLHPLLNNLSRTLSKLCENWSKYFHHTETGFTLTPRRCSAHSSSSMQTFTFNIHKFIRLQSHSFGPPGKRHHWSVLQTHTHLQFLHHPTPTHGRSSYIHFNCLWQISWGKWSLINWRCLEVSLREKVILMLSSNNGSLENLGPCHYALYYIL